MNHDDNDYEFDKETLLGQLNLTSGTMPNEAKRNEIEPHVDNEGDDLDNEIIQMSRELADNSLKVVNTFAKYAALSQSHEDVEAVSKVIQSASQAITNLQKYQDTKKKLKQQRELKVMEIKSKEERSNKKNETAVLMNREAILKTIIERQEDVAMREASGEVIDIPNEPIQD